MGGLTSVSDANLLRINGLSQMTGMARETVATKIQRVRPTGKRTDHPAFRLIIERDAVAARIRGSSSGI